MGFLAWVWGRNGGVLGFLRFPFTAASWCYGLISALRIFLYKVGILQKKRVDCHVISIGNITTGGTGKTPMTIYLAEQWQENGYRVGIVSRGYQRKDKASVVLVSDGSKPLATADAVGDEPVLMAERLQGVPIVVSKDRFKGCQYLISRFGVDVVLLDDGFQHLRLHRDLNLLMIDATSPFGNGYLLPRGPLREPLSGMKRSDFVIFSRADDPLPMHELLRQVKPFQNRMLQCRFEAVNLIDLATGTRSEPSTLSGERVLPFCGIGNPKAFLDQLSRLGAKIEASIIFEDHHRYQGEDFIRMASMAKKWNVSWIVTTEKDAVKIKHYCPSELKIFVLRIGPVFKKGSEALVLKLFKK